ncbi:MAG: ABC transporter ATP-binding protein [Oscillospiraceae bacterium]|nr:ABC transporter ATP-binding protein [Oscillospiraceae bacterium]
MITLNNVTKTYARGGVRAVDNLDLHVRRGEIFGFLGPNGAGKSTTIKMMTGILQPTEGTVFIDGVNLAESPEECKAKIGYVPDQHEMFERLSGFEYLNFIGDVYGVSALDRAARMNKYLDMFELGDAAGSLIRSYSRGMKQKLLLVGALLHNPPLWILDEPMVGLDPKSALRLKEQMRAHCDAGNTVFFSTHVLEVAERLCDRIGIINGGRLAAVGTMDELRSGKGDETLEKLFFELTEKDGGEEL